MVAYFLQTATTLFLSFNLNLAPLPPAFSTVLVQQPSADQLYETGMKQLEQATVESRNQAIASFEAAAKQYQKAGNIKLTARSLQMVGLVYFSLGEYEQTLNYYQQALPLWQSLEDRSGTAYLLASTGMVHSNLSQHSQAFDTLNQAVQLLRELQDVGGEALALNILAEAYFKIGETAKAINFFNQVLTLQKQANDIASQAETLQSITRLYLELGDLPKAREILNQLKALQPNFEDKAGLSELLENVANGQTTLAENLLTLEQVQQFLALQQNQGNQPNIGEANTIIAILQSGRGEYQKGLDAYQEALQIFRQIKLRDREAKILVGMGEIYENLGQYQKSLDLYTQALQLQDEISDRTGQTNTLRNLAQLYNSLGDYDRSLAAYNQALIYAKARGDRMVEAQILDSISTLYRFIKDYPKSLEFAQQALTLWQKYDIFFGQVATLSTLARTYEEMGDYPQALETAKQLQLLGQKTQDPFAEGVGWQFMSRVYFAMGEPQQALNPATQALSLFQKVNKKPAIVPVLNQMGKVYSALNQPQQALETFNQAMVLWKELGDRSGEADTLYNLAKFNQNQGDLLTAKTNIESALTIIEDLRRNVSSQELRQTYFSTVQDYYEFYIDLLMQLHKQETEKGFDALALHASERAKARSLIELLAEANIDIRQGVDPQLLDQEKRLQAQLNTLEKLRVEQLSRKAPESQIKSLDQQRQTLNQQYETLLDQIRAKSPRYAALTQPQPLTVTEIQQQLLDENTVLLEYSLGKERSYIWVVTKNSLRSYELPPKAKIETAIREFRTALSTKIRLEKINQTAQEISNLILAPFATELGNQRLVIVADGALQYIPFAALPHPQTQQPLIVNHEIINLPSASTLAVIRKENQSRSPASKTLAILADPIFNSEDERVTSQIPNSSVVAALPLESQQISRAAKDAGIDWDRLPGTRQEAEGIEALVPETERIASFDFQANREWVMSSNLGNYKIIHFATHGFANSKNPELSGIVLSLINQQGQPENGFLRLRDIYNLNLPVELVVLSACQTGLGQVMRGEGIIGLTRGFMYAGSSRVVTSLWNVDDQGTALLMSIFYQKMLKENLSPAAALRAAQMTLLQQEKWRSPYYWAAFSLQGEW